MNAIVGIDHLLIALPAGGEEKARAFYGDLLGLTEIEKPAPLAPRGGCWFEGPGFQIHLGVEANFTPARKAHPCLRVADLPALRAHLQEAGATITQDDADLGVDRCYVADPFGNRIELIQDGQGFSQRKP